MVQRKHDRDIERAPVQLVLPFGGRRTSNTPGHDGSLLNYDEAVSVEAVFAAWSKFQRGKRSRDDVLAYERRLEENLFELQHDLATGRYRHGSYTPFTICDPKQRQIHKATVRDRIVHQLIVSSIEPLFERRFIYDSFSCRRGKGTHAAVARLRAQLRRASCNDTRTIWALKCDIKKFFASVDHTILRELLKQRITDPGMLALIDKVITSHVTVAGKGMPLGNLTSQLIANIYLHELDWFMKQALGRKYYIRYCDDFVILGEDREDLLHLVASIGRFLQERLALSLHPAKVTVRSWHQGIDFLGYVVKPQATLLRTQTRRRMLSKVNAGNLSSYEGLCSHANTYQTLQLLQILAKTAAEA